MVRAEKSVLIFLCVDKSKFMYYICSVGRGGEKMTKRVNIAVFHVLKSIVDSKVAVAKPLVKRARVAQGHNDKNEKQCRQQCAKHTAKINHN